MTTSFANKIAMALLGMLLFVMGINLFSDAIFSNPKPATPGFDLPSGEKKAGPAVAAAAAVPLPTLLAKADVKAGEAAMKACAACHTFAKGAASKPTGPDLYGVVGRAKGSTGFAYSDAMKAKGGAWTFEDLDAFVANPKGFVSGTKMSYGGEKDAAKRADILVYLRSISDAPVALPAAK
jgi:cytochrome c